ncbi:MAG: T9SS type A sorting domain-containing protein [Candidatus Cloacimonetes bacterium]|jgi:hypothetical protein|nr:T9SS type A sorting domain-containing protein [Candidatus Cloacimonadota bacterium]MCB5287694.1 T9SS type A sorting domain-containing protein [Candidatus Cloacimonadota bacterium]MCK9184708.1 T9SS type A sorting domain-containing protein [Candidatus Cloacimonadota bacterium]MCK9585100.1 T9SS type A sorting domain-containing protein [Candidatus Cloacimonadota bacterium]MDY0230015.1 FlgD immunoglobulin-like domain containing protein [Candidatus Cloacimonadaceae bacterium]
MKTILQSNAASRTAKLSILLLGIFILSALSAETWNISDVAPFPGGMVTAVGGSGLALDSNGLPHIICYQPRSSNTKLWHSHLVNNQWTTEELSLAGLGINTGPGVCIDADDNIHVAFINRNLRLAYAFYDGNWTIEQVDPTRLGTSWVGMVLDQSGNPHIAYTGTDQGHLNYAKKIAGIWNIQELSSNGGGSVTSIVMDSLDHPHILSWPNSAHRYWDGTQWQVDFVTGPGTYSSLALDAQDRPQISYYLAQNDTYSLWFMTKNSGTWEQTLIDPGVQQDKRGWDTHILCDSEGILHIVYFCHNEALIRHAWGTGSAWETETIDDVGIWYSSIAFVMDGDVKCISYYDDAEGYLRYATTQEFDLESPANLQAEVTNVNDILLTWDAPSANPVYQVTGYGVYMDQDLVDTTDGDVLQTLIPGLGEEPHTFYVTALCGQMESGPSNEVEVAISLAPPLDFAIQVVSTGIVCRWERPLSTNVTAFMIYRNGVMIGNTEFLAFLDSNVPAGIHSYWATAIYNSTHESPASNTEEIDTLGNSDLNLTPLSNQLLDISPNPFKLSTQISFSLADKGQFELCIYNLKGEKVKTLASESQKAGIHSTLWNGSDESGRKVSSGIYLALLKTQNTCSSRKLILLK